MSSSKAKAPVRQLNMKTDGGEIGVLWPFVYQTKSLGLRMTTRYDRPEGYGLIPVDYRMHQMRSAIMAGGRRNRSPVPTRKAAETPQPLLLRSLRSLAPIQPDDRPDSPDSLNYLCSRNDERKRLSAIAGHLTKTNLLLHQATIERAIDPREAKTLHMEQWMRVTEENSFDTQGVAQVSEVSASPTRRVAQLRNQSPARRLAVSKSDQQQQQQQQQQSSAAVKQAQLALCLNAISAPVVPQTEEGSTLGSLSSNDPRSPTTRTKRRGEVSATVTGVAVPLFKASLLKQDVREASSWAQHCLHLPPTAEMLQSLRNFQQQLLGRLRPASRESAAPPPNLNDDKLTEMFNMDFPNAAVVEPQAPPAEANCESMLPQVHSLEDIPRASIVEEPQEQEAPPPDVPPIRHEFNADYQRYLDRAFLKRSADDMLLSYVKAAQVHASFVECASAFVRDNLLTRLLSEVYVEENGVSYALQTTPILAVQSNDEGGAPSSQAVTQLLSLCDDEDGVAPTAELSDKFFDEFEAQRRLSSNEIKALNALASCWHHDDYWSYFFPTAKPRERSASLDRAVEMRKRSPAYRREEEQRRARRICLPLCCSVYFLGHVVMCTATISSQFAEPDEFDLVQKSNVTGFLLSAVAALGLTPYYRFTPSKPDGALVPLSTTVSARCTTDTHRAYIVSCPGALPPLSPTAGYSRWTKLRPEMTAAHTEPLCADAFRVTVPQSEFLEKAEACIALVKALRRVSHRAIAHLVDRFQHCESSVDGQEICDVFHRLGINLCFLGYAGDLVAEKIRCLHATGSVRSREEDTLRKVLAVLKEEMVVRSFRVKLNSALRAQSLRGATDVSTYADTATEMLRLLFGREFESATMQFWLQQIAPTAREKFAFHGSIYRTDVSILTAIPRICKLCAFDVGNPVMSLQASQKTEVVLKNEIRCNRQCVVGNVLSLKPFVKAAALPPLPPFDFLAAEEATVSRFEADMTRLHSDSFQAAEFACSTALRKAELLRCVGEALFSQSEFVLRQLLRDLSSQFVPDPRYLAEVHSALGSLYNVEHRYSDAQSHYRKAIKILQAHGSEHSLALDKLYRQLATSSKDGAARESAVHALECACAVVLRKVRQNEASPLYWHLQSNREQNSAETSFLHDRFSEELAELSDDLSVMYGMVPPSNYPPLPSCAVSSEFLLFVHHLGVCRLQQSNVFSGYGALFRACMIAEALSRGSGANPMTVATCHRNLELAEHLMTGKDGP